jgi:hypothetical protein
MYASHLPLGVSNERVLHASSGYAKGGGDMTLEVQIGPCGAPCAGGRATSAHLGIVASLV